jgi:hypothetical protein
MEFPENGGNLGFIMKINNQGICEWLQQTSRIVNIPTTFDVPSSFKNICINEEDNEIYVTGHGNAMVSSCCLDFFTLLPNNDTVLGAFEDSGNTIKIIWGIQYQKPQEVVFWVNPIFITIIFMWDYFGHGNYIIWTQ